MAAPRTRVTCTSTFDDPAAVVRPEVVDGWDHRDLNEVPDNPTADG